MAKFAISQLAKNAETARKQIFLLSTLHTMLPTGRTKKKRPTWDRYIHLHR
jgi:hypothetical protein